MICNLCMQQTVNSDFRSPIPSCRGRGHTYIHIVKQRKSMRSKMKKYYSNQSCKFFAMTKK